MVKRGAQVSACNACLRFVAPHNRRKVSALDHRTKLRLECTQPQVRVVTRHAAGVRGSAEGTLIAVDRYMNLILRDVTEAYTVIVKVSGATIARKPATARATGCADGDQQLLNHAAVLRCLSAVPSRSQCRVRRALHTCLAATTAALQVRRSKTRLEKAQQQMEGMALAPPSAAASQLPPVGTNEAGGGFNAGALAAPPAGSSGEEPLEFDFEAGLAAAGTMHQATPASGAASEAAPAAAHPANAPSSSASRTQASGAQPSTLSHAPAGALGAADCPPGHRLVERVRWCRKQEHRRRTLHQVFVKGDNVVLVACAEAPPALAAVTNAQPAAATPSAPGQAGRVR